MHTKYWILKVPALWLLLNKQSMVIKYHKKWRNDTVFLRKHSSIFVFLRQIYLLKMLCKKCFLLIFIVYFLANVYIHMCNLKIYTFSLKWLCAFFTSADFSYYFVQKYWSKIIENSIFYQIFYNLLQLKCKISRKL